MIVRFYILVVLCVARVAMFMLSFHFFIHSL